MPQTATVRWVRTLTGSLPRKLPEHLVSPAASLHFASGPSSERPAGTWESPRAPRDLGVRVRAGGLQRQVLHLLDTHRLLTAVHIHALAFETATRRNCEICVQCLHQKGWAVRAEPRTVDPGAVAAATYTASPTRGWRCCPPTRERRGPTSRSWPIRRRSSWGRATSSTSRRSAAVCWLSGGLPPGPPPPESRSERKIDGGRDSSTRRQTSSTGCPRTRRPTHQVRRPPGGVVSAPLRRAVGTTPSTTAGAPLPASPRGRLMAAGRRSTVGHSRYRPASGPIWLSAQRDQTTAAGLAHRSVADADGPEPVPPGRSPTVGRGSAAGGGHCARPAPDASRDG